MIKDIFKISNNIPRADSLIEMAKERFADISKETKPYKIIEEYYEIIKEIITSIMYRDGHKTLSHTALIIYLEINYKEINKQEIFIINELRKLRNNILYYGQRVSKEYLINHESEIRKIIQKLFDLRK